MSSPHVVESLHFEFAFGDETEAFELQDRISRFASERAAGVIEQVFDEVGGGEDLLRLQLVELDLGVLPLHESDDDWDSRLREALKLELHDRQAATSTLHDRNPASDLKRQSRAQADLELIWSWLHHGALPWHAAMQDRVAFDGMLDRVLDRYGAALARSIRRSPDSRRLLQRAERQWPAAAFARLGRWLADDTPLAAPGPRQDAPAAQPAGGPEVGVSRLSHPAGKVDGAADGNDIDIAARVAQELRDDAAALRIKLTGLNVQDPQWDRLAGGLDPASRRALLALLAPPGEAAFVEGLAASAMLQTLARPGPAADRAAAVCAATLRALHGVGACVADRHRLVALTLAELTAWTGTRPGSGPPHEAASSERAPATDESAASDRLHAPHANTAVRSASAELTRHLAPLLHAVPLRLATPAPLLTLLTAWADAAAWLAIPTEADDDDAQALALRDALERQLEAAGLDESSPAWPALVHRDAPWVRERLLRHGRRAAWRRQFARALAPARLAELLALWAPLADVTRLSRLLSDPIAWTAGHPRAAAEMATLLREWLLSSLLTESEPAFDIVTCVRSLLTQRAQHDALAERAVLAALQARWAGDSAFQGPSALLQRLAKGLAEPVHGVEPVKPAEGFETAEDFEAVESDDSVESTASAQSQSLAAFDAGVSAPLPAPTKRAETRAGADRSPLSQWLQRLPQGLPPAWRRELARRLESAATARAVFEQLTPDELHALLLRLLPETARPMQALLQALREAAITAEVPLSAAQLEAFEWRFIQQECFEEGRRFESAGFVRRWCETLVNEAGAAAPAAVDHGWPRRLRGAVLPWVRVAGSRPVASAPARAPSPVVLAPAPDPVADGATLYLRHAGLVLAGPYLPRLWARLELTGPNGFVDDDAAERATHLLHWLACGRQGAVEHELVLNKLLCGIDLQTPLRAEVALSERESQAADELLLAMIRHWQALGRTSPAGLRESFLQRQGALTHDETGWRLLVEPRSYDMLLDTLPWGFKTLRFPWMKEVLHVQWR
jgi:Contractile injection system tape measure protein